MPYLNASLRPVPAFWNSSGACGSKISTQEGPLFSPQAAPRCRVHPITVGNEPRTGKPTILTEIARNHAASAYRAYFFETLRSRERYRIFATLSTIVSPASPAVSAPGERQNSSLPSNSVQAAPNDAITTAGAAPATTATTEVPRQPAAPATTATTEAPRQPVAASKKPQRTARSQNRPHRGWYNAYAWLRPADYWRRRGYGHERLSSSW